MRAAIRQVLFSQPPFSPRLLFANGEQGAWFDPSDFGSMFQDSAGTIPVTAIEQPVGLILDKSGRGNHASQSTTTARPILRNRYNLLVQTDSLSTQSITSVATSYTLRFEGAGTVTLSGTATGTLSAGSNTFSATAGTLTLTVSGTVANAMLTQANDANIPYQWVATGAQSTSNPVSTVTAGYDTDTSMFPPYLALDGTDDWLQTSAINFSASGTMSVFAGVRKFNELLSRICELGTSIASNANSFVLAPGNYSTATGPHWTYASRGTAALSSNQAAESPASYPAPITTVLTGLSSISADTTILRANGAQVALSTGDQGSGNYGSSYALYIGIRAGTTLPLNGRIYSLIIRGAMTNSPQLEQTERWVAAKTGVTI